MKLANDTPRVQQLLDDIDRPRLLTVDKYERADRKDRPVRYQLLRSIRGVNRRR